MTTRLEAASPLQGLSFGVFNINATQINDTSHQNEVFSRAESGKGLRLGEQLSVCVVLGERAEHKRGKRGHTAESC
jgi:hypothetical protein